MDWPKFEAATLVNMIITGVISLTTGLLLGWFGHTLSSKRERTNQYRQEIRFGQEQRVKWEEQRNQLMLEREKYSSELGKFRTRRQLTARDLEGKQQLETKVSEIDQKIKMSEDQLRAVSQRISELEELL